ncbi:nitrate reductase associated protein [Flavihumibacter sediminis]|nr:nitrate reductase associated protein [Flavihumibacter sediminis]
MHSIEYFRFESDFVEDNIRCIPMIVRLKLDLTGVKLSLSAWSKCSVHERQELGTMPCNSADERSRYRAYAERVVRVNTDEPIKYIPVPIMPLWDDIGAVPEELKSQADIYGWTITKEQWKILPSLRRFALLKLCRPGHENRNFPLAMREFGLVN